MTEPKSATPAATPNSSEIHGSLARGIAWTGAAKWLTQLVTWGATLVVAHILGPEAYGLVGMAGLFMGLVTMFTEFGLGTAIVSLRTLDWNQIAQINSVAVLLGFSGTLITCAAAWPLSRFFHEPAVMWIIIAMSSNFLISAIRLVPYSLLQRDLKFKRLAMLESAQAIIFALANMLFAWLGFGYWTLVIGAVISQTFGTVSTLVLRRHGYVRPTRAGVRGVLRFSGHILIGRLAWYSYSNSDFAVAGKVLGKAALGAYSFAWQFAGIPIDKITSLVTRVTPAYFAAAQDDNATIRKILLNVTEGIAFLTLPATVGISLVAKEFVPLVLGPEWTATIAPLQVLCVYASYRSLVTLLPQILNVKGDARWTMWLGVITALVLPASFFAGSRFGPVGIAAMWILIYPIFTIPLYRRTFMRIEMPFRDYMAVLWSPIRGTLLMAAAVMATRLVLPESWPLALRCGLLATTGALVYAATTALPQRERLRKILVMVRTPPAKPAATNV
ncbi:MAG: lipopolysaccharide biosynthesis protein [Gemmatimonadota bacterium]